MYNLVVEVDLNNKIKEVETAHANSKHGLSWRLVNYITGRKASAQGQLKGETQKDRVINWYNHFKNFLGSPPDISDAILEGLNIKFRPFSEEEYEKAKKSLLKGKTSGEDKIPAEVLKRCELDFCPEFYKETPLPHICL